MKHNYLREKEEKKRDSGTESLLRKKSVSNIHENINDIDRMLVNGIYNRTVHHKHVI